MHICNHGRLASWGAELSEVYLGQFTESWAWVNLIEAGDKQTNKLKNYIGQGGLFSLKFLLLEQNWKDQSFRRADFKSKFVFVVVDGR